MCCYIYLSKPIHAHENYQLAFNLIGPMSDHCCPYQLNDRSGARASHTKLLVEDCRRLTYKPHGQMMDSTAQRNYTGFEEPPQREHTLTGVPFLGFVR